MVEQRHGVGPDRYGGRRPVPALEVPKVEGHGVADQIERAAKVEPAPGAAGLWGGGLLGIGRWWLGLTLLELESCTVMCGEAGNQPSHAPR